MPFDHLLSATNISASGLSAERTHMEVVANNVANAHTTRTAQGWPFRRQNVVFEAVLDERLGTGRGNALRPRGVRVVEIAEDTSELPRVYQPGHPDADASGHVILPNVSLPTEMVNLIAASRAYEANLKVLQAFRQQVEQALLLIRS
jgi:flagellar basal-body rod protein FlgC